MVQALQVTYDGSQIVAFSHLCQRCGERPATCFYDPVAFTANSQYVSRPANMVAVCGACNPFAIHCACCSQRQDGEAR